MRARDRRDPRFHPTPRDSLLCAAARPHRALPRPPKPSLARAAAHLGSSGNKQWLGPAEGARVPRGRGGSRARNERLETTRVYAVAAAQGGLKVDFHDLRRSLMAGVMLVPF